MVLMPGFQSTRLATEGALEPFLFLYTDDSIQGNPETCNQSSMMLNYEVKNNTIYPDRLCKGDTYIEQKEIIITMHKTSDRANAIFKKD